MPRVRVERPDRDIARQYAREYALLQQLNESNKDDVDSQQLEKFASKYGNSDKVRELSSKGDVKFADFAAAFEKKGKSVEGDGNCIAYAARDSTGKLSPYKFQRRQCRPNDVAIQITYAGMCHSDIHTIRGEWGNVDYPLVPGHEMIGVVIDVGSDVKKFKLGDIAGVGCMVDACLECEYCKNGDEQYCAKGMVGTYNGKLHDGEVTQGGYSTHIVVREQFVISVAPHMHVPGTAPLLCAGITVYSPMKHYAIDKQGLKVGVVGLGGLGHMAVKIGKAFGQHVTIFSRSDNKREEATRELGADEFLVSKDPEQMKAAAGSFDAIIDTVSAQHDLNEYLGMLKTDGKLIMVGAPAKPLAISAFGILAKRRMIGGSLIGGIRETQEMMDFCAKHNITSFVEVIPVDKVNEAVDRVVEGDVKFRFVIDTLGSLIMDQAPTASAA